MGILYRVGRVCPRKRQKQLLHTHVLAASSARVARPREVRFISNHASQKGIPVAISRLVPRAGPICLLISSCLDTSTYSCERSADGSRLSGNPGRSNAIYAERPNGDSSQRKGLAQPDYFTRM